MEVLHARCAGIDVSKRDAKVCVRVQGSGRRSTSSTVTTWGSTTRDVLALRDHLVAAEVSSVVIESTGDYWKPFYYLLEPDLAMVLVNAREAKTVPGRKSDVADAAWLADLGAHGLVRRSFVPPPPVRDLRDLTRTRAAVRREHGREIQRLEKLLEGAQIKLSSVATDLTGVSCRLMLRAIAGGESDPQRLADLARGKLRVKRAALIEALTGQVRPSHRRLIGLHLDRIEALDADQRRIEDWIEEAMTPFLAARDLIRTIPGIDRHVADVVIAEIGDDITVFPTAGHLCSWAGVAPGQRESAGRTRPVKCRPGNTHLKAALGIAALSATRSKGTYLSAKYRRLAKRRGKLKALVAIQRTMLVSIWTLLTTGAEYVDPGADYYHHHDSQRVRRRALQDLRALGYQVTLDKAA